MSRAQQVSRDHQVHQREQTEIAVSNRDHGTNFSISSRKR